MKEQGVCDRKDQGGSVASALGRREFARGALCAAAAAAAPRLWADGAVGKDDDLDLWQKETDLVKADVYGKYMKDGDVRGLKSLERLEMSFEKVFKETAETVVGDVPAVWSVYNMGYIVKTRESLFSIDLVHRRDTEFAPMLDFALITHNHGDHWR